MASAKISKPIVLQPQDRLDRKAGRTLQQQISDLAIEKHTLLVIDMADVKFVDSSGLFALVAGTRTAREMGCRLVLCNLKETVRLILEISQIDQMFEIFESYEQLLKTVGAESIPSLTASFVGV